MLFSLMIQTAEGCGDPGHGLTSPCYVNVLIFKAVNMTIF